MSLRIYLVTMDLLLAEDYASLKTRLVSLGARQILGNQWALRSTYTAAEIKEILRGFLDPRDRIVVTEVGAEWASRRALANLGEV
ncbi:MAG: hypothetical protein IT160_05415 [Bryobacterales bacterium]|nr:hypothetical protein [Bryobacterales bacterium]